MDLFIPRIKRLSGPTTIVMFAPDGRVMRRRIKWTYHHEYHLAKREERIAKMRERYRANRQEYLVRAKQWAAKNPEKRRAISRRWDAANLNARLVINAQS